MLTQIINGASQARAHFAMRYHLIFCILFGLLLSGCDEGLSDQSRAFWAVVDDMKPGESLPVGDIVKRAGIEGDD